MRGSSSKYRKMISTDEIVLPMVKGGNPMSEMILK